MEDSVRIGYIMDPEVKNQLPAVKYISSLPEKYDRRALAGLSHNASKNNISPQDILADNERVAGVDELWIFTTDTFNPDLQEGNYIFERAKQSGTSIRIFKTTNGNMRECISIEWNCNKRGEYLPVYSSYKDS